LNTIGSGWEGPFARRYVFIQGRSDKFWEVTLVEGVNCCICETRWGRRGTAGQVLRKSFRTNREARRYVRTKCQEKEDKGYMLVGEIKGDENKPTAPMYHGRQRADGKHRQAVPERRRKIEF